MNVLQEFLAEIVSGVPVFDTGSERTSETAVPVATVVNTSLTLRVHGVPIDDREISRETGLGNRLFGGRKRAEENIENYCC